VIEGTLPDLVYSISVTNGWYILRYYIRARYHYALKDFIILLNRNEIPFSLSLGSNFSKLQQFHSLNRSIFLSPFTQNILTFSKKYNEIPFSLLLESNFSKSYQFYSLNRPIILPLFTQNILTFSKKYNEIPFSLTLESNFSKLHQFHFLNRPIFLSFFAQNILTFSKKSKM
jgi:hypothetical protein